MDPELKREIEEMHALVKDNHRMLRAIRRSQWLSFMSTVIIWIVVLALPLYLYQQYLAPIVANFSAASGMSTTTTSGFLGLPTSAELQKLINSAKSGQ
jgi:Trk-type K+ transport system membrane component